MARRKSGGASPSKPAGASDAKQAEPELSAEASAPTTASELKALLRQALELQDAVANASPTAASESPLLLRTDTTTPRASPDKNKTSGRKKEPRRTLRPQELRPTPPEPSASASAAHDSLEGGGASDVPSQDSADHRPRETRRSAASWCFGSRASSSASASVPPWGPQRLLVALGTLRTPPTEQQQTLSRAAQAQLQALAPLAKSCWVELFVERSDELPFGVYSKPQVRVHLVDRFSGRATQPAQTTSPAKLNLSCRYANAFKWCEPLRFPVALTAFLSPRTLLLVEVFEVLGAKRPKQQPQQRNGARDHQAAHSSSNSDPDRRARRIAWGFYTPVTERGDVILRSLSPLDDADDADDLDARDARLERAPPRDDGCVRLQLFEYQVLTWMDAYQARSQWPAASSRNSNMPSVYLQYQKQRRAAVPSTLFIDVRPIVPPLGVSSGGGAEPTADVQEAAQQPNGGAGGASSDGVAQDSTAPAHSAAASSGSRDGAGVSPSAAPEQAMSTTDPLIACKRGFSETCLVPHRVLCRLPTGKRGCSCVAFSPCGLLLAAAASADSDDVVVHVFRVNSSQLLRVCRGHRGMVYSLEWHPSSQQLLSASSDGTARLWSISISSSDGESTRSAGGCSVWQHTPAPCFVYCGIFHPVHVGLALSGASDGLVRFWSTTPSRLEAGRLRVSKGAAVHSVRVEPKSGRLLCGDARGVLTVWGPSPAATAAAASAPAAAAPSYELVKTIATGQSSITSLALHPRKQHLLVHTQPNGVLQYELRSFLLLNKSYAGVECAKLLGRSVFSPDGRFVASSSENGVPLLFASVQGQRFQHGVWGRPFFPQFPVSDVSWSPSAHIVALCSYGGNHPIVLLCAHRTDEDVAQHLHAPASLSTSVAAAQPQRALAGASERLTPEAAASRTGTPSDDQDERVQRALTRRRQRLQAKLALETESETQRVEIPAHASI